MVPDIIHSTESNLAIIPLEGEKDTFIIEDTSLPFAISPDPRYAAACGPTDMVILDIENSQQTQVLHESGKLSGRSTVLKFTHDGRYLLSPNKDGVGVWEVETGNFIDQLKAPDREGVFMPELRNSILFTDLCEDEGWLLATGGTDFDKSSIYLWHLESAELLHTFSVFTAVMSIAVYQNDRFLACSGEEEIRIWKLDWEYDFPAFADWDESARPYLDVFLAKNTPFVKGDISGQRKPQWTEDEFQKFLRELGLRGYGWLRPEGLRHQLEIMAAE